MADPTSPDANPWLTAIWPTLLVALGVTAAAMGGMVRRTDATEARRYPQTAQGYRAMIQPPPIAADALP